VEDNAIREQVAIALRFLGDTSEDVAVMLQLGGWLGLRNHAGACPLARYLANVVPNADGAAVGSDEATIHFVYRPDVEVDLTRAAAEFVTAFDDGEFPDLVVEDCDINGDVIDGANR
jgi:hypothetical protein